MNKGQFQKGHNVSEKTKRRLHESNWKGNNIDYSTLHKWVYQKLGSPDICESCKISGLKGSNINWANKSGEYKRDIEDWIRLCVKCHRKKDRKTPEFCNCGNPYLAKGMCSKCYMRNYMRNRALFKSK